jgi:hypothetical protein
MMTNTQLPILNENDWQLNERSTKASADDQVNLAHETTTVDSPRRRVDKPFVFALLIVALLGVAGTVVGFMSGDDKADTTSPDDTAIAALTAERDGLIADMAGLDSTIVSLTAERDDFVEQVSTLGSDLDAGVMERDGLVDQLAELDSRIETVAAERAAAASRVVSLEADLAAQAELTADAIKERDALAALFPVTFEGALVVDDLVGTYDADYTKTFCEGFANCTTEPSAEATLRETSEGYLELVMDDYLTAGLFRADGALVAVADTTSGFSACGGTPRVARVVATVYPSGVTVGSDGAVQVGALAASITVQSAATANCPAGLAIYGAQLVPQV